MGKEIPDDITNVERIQAPKSVQPGEEGQPNTERPFSSYMEGGQPQAAGPTSSAPSPFDLAQGSGRPSIQPTQDSIIGQMNSVSGVLGDVQQQLNTKNLKLKPAQKYLLRNKLGESNTLIRGTAEKLGVDTGTPPSQLSRQNPIARFLSFINDSQVQISSAQQKLQEIGSSGKQLEPGEMLLIQVKLAKAQQELEYSSVLLSNAVQDVKTLFNIQI